MGHALPKLMHKARRFEGGVRIGVNVDVEKEVDTEVEVRVEVEVQVGGRM